MEAHNKHLYIGHRRCHNEIMLWLELLTYNHKINSVAEAAASG